MQKRTPWTEADVALLKQWYADHPLKAGFNLDELAAKLGRNKANVSRKARSLGLTNHRRPYVEEPEKTVRAVNPDGSITFRHRPKHETDEERSAAISVAVRRYQAAHGHPRGFLGGRHTEAVKQSIAEQNRAWWQTVTPEQHEAWRVQKIMTNIERYGVANPSFVTASNPYSRGHRGYIEDIPGIHFRSGWEANYARYLKWLKDQGEIQEWSYEPEAFIFHGVTRAPVTYTPDFRVVESDGSVVYHEVKGWMDGKSKSKLKRMAKFYPDVTVIVVDESAYKAIARWASVIPHWGEMPRTRKQMEEGAA